MPSTDSIVTRASLWPWSQVRILVAAATAMRIVFWWLASGSEFFGTPVVDASFFDIWARALAEGRTFQDAAYFKPPFMAALLSFFYRMGFGLIAVQVLQMIVGVITVLLTLAVARLVLTPRQALWAALAVALLPVLPFFEFQLLAETWTTALTMAAMLCVMIPVKDARRHTVRWMAGAGILLGLAALGRPNLMVVLAVLAGWVWFFGRARRTSIIALVAGFLIAIAPATLHNLKYGEFTLISANLGANLVTGNSDRADGVSAIPVGVVWDDLQLRTRQAGKDSPGAASRFLTGEALRWIAGNPARFLELIGKKSLLLISGWEGRNNIHPGFLARHDGVWLLARWWPGVWLMLPFALLGCVKAVRGVPPARLIFWLVVIQAAAVLPFFVNARFRAPLLPLIAILAALGAGFVLESWRANDRRRFAIWTLVLILLFPVVNVDWFGLGADRWMAQDHFNLGLIRMRSYGDRQADPARAEEAFMKALEQDEGDVDAHERYGAMLLQRAQQLLERGDALERSGSWNEAATAMAGAENLLRRAAGHHSRAAEIFPRSFRSWANLGTCRIWLADVQAFACRRELAAGNEENARRHAMQALRLYRDAVDDLDRSLEIDPTQQSTRQVKSLAGRGVLDLPDLDPVIQRSQEQIRQSNPSGTGR